MTSKSLKIIFLLFMTSISSGPLMAGDVIEFSYCAFEGYGIDKERQKVEKEKCWFIDSMSITVGFGISNINKNDNVHQIYVDLYKKKINEEVRERVTEYTRKFFSNSANNILGRNIPIVGPSDGFLSKNGERKISVDLLLYNEKFFNDGDIATVIIRLSPCTSCVNFLEATAAVSPVIFSFPYSDREDFYENYKKYLERNFPDKFFK